MDIKNIDWKKETLDQFGHFIAGLIPVFLFSYLGMNIYIAAGVVFLFAVLREIKQRIDKKDKWYSCGWGCRLDLVFWFIGINVGIVLYYIFIH